MLETVLFFTVSAVAAVVLLRSGRRLPALGYLALAVVAFAAFSAWRWTPATHRYVDDLPQRVGTDGFATSDTCRACHPGEYETWHATYHRTMTQVAKPDTVLGNFDDVTLTSRGRTYHLTVEDGEHWVDMVDPDWEMDEFFFQEIFFHRPSSPTSEVGAPRVKRRIVATTGSHHQQTYWVALEQGRELFQLPWSWLLDTLRWIPREDAFLRPPSERRTPAVWNMACIKCHSTGGFPETDPAAKDDTFFAGGRRPSMETKVADFGIACESCHGPAEEHVRRMKNPMTRYSRHLSGPKAPDAGKTTTERGDELEQLAIVNPAHLDHRRSAMVCGQCHSFWDRKDKKAWWFDGDVYRAGEDLHEGRRYVHYQEGDAAPRDRYWDDGVLRVGGREYNAMTDSDCFIRGEMSCLSCHSMHSSDPNDQLAAKMDGDHACIQCHPDQGRDDEAIRAHTHHSPESSGSRCYNCHMPHTTYALFKGIRNHTVDSPTARSTTEFGRPNACNLCHLDRSLEWTGKKLEKWYGHDRPRLEPLERRISSTLLQAVRGDAVHRALAAWHMGWGPAREVSGTSWSVPLLAQLLEDPYAAVRRVAFLSLRTLPGFEDLDYDYLAPSAQRREVITDVMQKWASSERDESARLPRLLFDEDGTFRQKLFERLLSQRDDRPVSIDE